MQLNVMVTVDLRNADSEQFELFETSMKQLQWVPSPGKFTAYCTTIEGDVSDEDVVALAEADMQASASAAGIDDWDGICLMAPPENTVVHARNDSLETPAGSRGLPKSAILR